MVDFTFSFALLQLEASRSVFKQMVTVLVKWYRLTYLRTRITCKNLLCYFLLTCSQDKLLKVRCKMVYKWIKEDGAITNIYYFLSCWTN